MAIPYKRLNNGKAIPPIGLGTFCGEGYEEIISKAIDVGYRLIDTAYVYQNEKQIGRSLERKIKEGKIRRDEVFVISKLWNTKHKPADVLPSIKKSLSDLRLDYLDLYLIHYPLALQQGEDEFELFELAEDQSVTIEETWLAMEECVKRGYTKSIGVSNFNSKQIRRIIRICSIKPVVNEIECHPYLSQEKLREFCKQQDIVVIAYSPLFPKAALCANSSLNLFEEPLIQTLAKKYGKTCAQIVIRYLVQCDVVPIPKTCRLERLAENYAVFDFCLSPEDFERMRLLNRNYRCVKYEPALTYKEYPFHLEY